MKIWVDAQLSPVIAQWLSSTYGVEAAAVRDLRLRDARDRDIFLTARDAKAILLTKDSDMIDLVTQLGAPPQILWVIAKPVFTDSDRDGFVRSCGHEMLLRFAATGGGFCSRW